jgi:hypothetical protein
MSADAATIVLKNITLRWSSPVEFNDPYDVPRELMFNIDQSEIQEELSKYLIGLIQNPTSKTDHIVPILQLLIDQSRNASPEMKEEIINAIKEEAAKRVAQSQAMEELRVRWRQMLLEFRILCLCESPHTVSMWYHYADKYRGAVIELACNDESDSPWLVAEKIDYPETIPEIFTPKRWAKLITMPERAAVEHLLHEYTYIKTPDWSYEKEWRVTSFKRPHETGTVSDYKINPNDFVAVYLGPLIDPVDRERILKILKDGMSHVQPYQAEFGINRRIEFKPIEE